MSEKAPESAYSRLRDFEANKAAYEAEQERLAQENYANEFYGEAGHTDFSDEAKTRLQELDDYEFARGFANNPAEAADTPEAREAYYDRMLNEADRKEHGLHQPVEGTLEYAEEEAYAEKEKREAEEAAYVEANERAIDAKIDSNSQLRRMNDLAREIAELRAETDPKDPDAAMARVRNKEDALNNLLAQYENNALYTINKDKDSLLPVIKVPVKYDPAVADVIMNRTQDSDLERKNSEEARRRADTTPEDGKERSEPGLDLEDGDSGDGRSDPGLDLEDGSVSGNRGDSDLDLEDGTIHETHDDTDTRDDPGLDLEGGSIPPGDTDPTRVSDPVEAEGGWFAKWRERRRSGEKLSTKTKVTIAVGALATAAAVGVYAWLTSKGMAISGDSAKDAIDATNTTSGTGGGVGGGLDVLDPSSSVEISNAATVHPGAGWDEIMKNNGVAQSEWAGRLREIGPDLADKGWAYWDKVAGEWRISHPGELPQSVLELIKNGNR